MKALKDCHELEKILISLSDESEKIDEALISRSIERNTDVIQLMTNIRASLRDVRKYISEDGILDTLFRHMVKVS